MNGFQTIIAWILLVASALGLSSCSSQGYDDDLSNVYMNGDVTYNVDLATVVIPGETPGQVMIESDDLGYMYVANPTVLTKHDANREGQRIFYSYRGTGSPLGLYDSRTYVFIIDLVKIRTKAIDVRSDSEADVYGTDGIGIIGHSLSKKYLTLQYQIKMSDNNVAHRISLVVEDGAVPDEDGFLRMELCHDAAGDKPAEISQPEYVSFLLASAPGYVDGSLRGLNIKYLTLDGEETWLKLAFEGSKSISQLSLPSGMSAGGIKVK